MRGDFMNEVLKVRMTRAAQVLNDCYELIHYKRESIPKSRIRRLEDYRTSLVAMKDDPFLSSLADYLLQLLDETIQFAHIWNNCDDLELLKQQLKRICDLVEENDHLVGEIVRKVSVDGIGFESCYTARR
jgi:hypothetical protein